MLRKKIGRLGNVKRNQQKKKIKIKKETYIGLKEEMEIMREVKNGGVYHDCLNKG